MKMQTATATDFSSCYLHEEHYMTESQSKVGSAHITNGADAEPRGERTLDLQSSGGHKHDSDETLMLLRVCCMCKELIVC